MSKLLSITCSTLIIACGALFTGKLHTTSDTNRIAEHQSWTLHQLLGKMGWSSFEQIELKLNRTRVKSERFSAALDASLQKANGVWNLGSFIGYCNGAEALATKAIYITLYAKAQELISKKHALPEHKAQFTHIPSFDMIKEFFEAAEWLSISSSARRIIRAAIQQWTIEEICAYLSLGTLYQVYSDEANAPYDPQEYRTLYIRAQQLCRLEGTLEQKSFLSLLCPPDVYEQLYREHAENND